MLSPFLSPVFLSKARHSSKLADETVKASVKENPSDDKDKLIEDVKLSNKNNAPGETQAEFRLTQGSFSLSSANALNIGALPYPGLLPFAPVNVARGLDYPAAHTRDREIYGRRASDQVFSRQKDKNGNPGFLGHRRRQSDRQSGAELFLKKPAPSVDRFTPSKPKFSELEKLKKLRSTGGLVDTFA